MNLPTIFQFTERRNKMGKIKKSLYSPNIRGVKTAHDIIKFCESILKKEEEQNEIYHSELLICVGDGNYIYIGGFNTIAVNVKLKEDAHPLIKYLTKYGHDYQSVVFGKNLMSLNDEYFLNHNWESRNGFIVITPRCLDHIYSTYDDIRDIKDLNKLLHADFHQYGEIYLSYVTIYEVESQLINPQITFESNPSFSKAICNKAKEMMKNMKDFLK